MSTGAPTRIELPVEGMSCASCAARIERKLNRLDGVHATVNYATERATVEYDPALAGTELIADTIEQTGYHAVLTPAGDRSDVPDEATSQIARRLWVSAAMTAPALALAMIPPLQFDGWQWFSLLLAATVVGWGGLPFHRAALANLRHGTATMDTLISVGTLAALGWSVVAMLFLGAGGLDYRMSYDWTFGAGGNSDDIYLEVAAVVTTLVLPGRFFESRASGGPVRRSARCSSWAPRRSRCSRPGARSRSRRQLRVGDLFVVRPGERVATDGMVARAVGGRQVAADRRAHPGRGWRRGRVAGATVNTYGRLAIRATRVGADTTLAQIARLVEEAQAARRRPAAGRPYLGVFVPVVDRALRWRRAGRLLLTGERRGPFRQRWPSSSSPAPARSGSLPRPRCWSAPAAAPSSAS